MDLITANIHNLISLWSLGGQRAGQLHEFDHYSISQVPGSEWPNKLWFKQVPESKTFENVLTLYDLTGITIPVWPGMPGIEEILIQTGMQLKNELTGMSISLQEFSQKATNVQVNEVNNRALAEEWSQLFYAAFEYRINSETVVFTMESVTYLIASIRGESVGTAVLFKDNSDVIGIHSMGIIPEHRRKGYAEGLLYQVLNRGRRSGAKYGVLQASAMGKALYQKTGFKEDFILRNYVNQNLELK